jgi:DnaJ-class molecular chaperone
MHCNDVWKNAAHAAHALIQTLTRLCVVPAAFGACRKLSLSRKLPCGKCNGTGSKSGKRHSCSTCHGSGVQVHIRPLGPGMVQQIQSRCGDCSGSGYSSVPSEWKLWDVWLLRCMVLLQYCVTCRVALKHALGCSVCS